jgi:hypothetical protein
LVTKEVIDREGKLLALLFIVMNKYSYADEQSGTAEGDSGIAA